MFNNPIVYTDPSGHNPKCGPDGIYCDNDRGNDYMGDPIPLSDMAQRLLDFAKSVGRSPEEVIANGFACELSGTDGPNGTEGDVAYRAAFREQVYNRFVWYAKQNCGGMLTYNCMLNYVTSNYQSVKNQYWGKNGKTKYWNDPDAYERAYDKNIAPVKLNAGKDIVDKFWGSMTPERRDFDPVNKPDDAKLPFNTGVVLATDVEKYLQPMNIYVIDFMTSGCYKDRSKAAYVLILNWYGTDVLSDNGVGVC